MIPDLARRFVDWAFANRRWPLLIPFSVPVVFHFLQQYEELTFRQTVLSAEFQWFTACMASLTAVLYLYVTRRRRVSALVVLAIALACVVGFALRHRASRIDEEAMLEAANRDVDLLMARQVPSSGFSYADPRRYQDSLSDPWNTAQALVAVLLATEDLNELRVTPDKLRAAFGYLERCRNSTGWGYTCRSPRSRTTITSWVVLAYVESLQIGLWGVPEDGVIKERIRRDVKELSSCQDPTGGFGDLGPYEPTTYSTAMTTWALAEARRTEVIPAQYDRAIQGGVHRLLNGFNPRKGWTPDPRRDGDESYPGLTEIVLFALVRAAASVPDLDRVQLLRIEKSTYLRNSTVTQPIDTSSQSSFTSDSLPVKFLWFPWSLATFSHLARDASLPAQDRQFASAGEVALSRRIVQQFRSDESSFTFQLAEDLIGVAVHLRCTRHGAC